MKEKEEANVEQKRLELDERRLQTEERLKEAELALRQRELDAKLDEASPTRILKLSSFSPTTIAAIIGIVATLVGYLIQANLNRELEREKFQGQLVLKAIETGDPQKARANLRFFFETGLLSDPDGKIKIALDQSEKNPASVPVLPSSKSQSAMLRGLVVDENNAPIAGARVRVEMEAGTVEVVTSANGEFYTWDFTATVGESLRIHVTKEGYHTNTQYVVMDGPVIIMLKKAQ